MAKVTYLDPTDDAPKVVWHGITFRAHQPVEVDREDILEAIRAHPYFKVTEAKAKAKAKAEEPEPEEDPAESSTEEAGKPHWDEEAEAEGAHTHTQKRKKHKKDAW